MVNKRDNCIKFIEYMQAQGIEVNIRKNKARGNKGIFKRSKNSCRIDISKCLSDDEVFQVLLHEFAHFIHYHYDNSLNTLDFVFTDYNDKIKEELINITVYYVPKSTAETLFSEKQNCTNQIKVLTNVIKKYHPEFKLSTANKSIEKNIKFPINYLLKYDRITFFNKSYSIDTIEKYSNQLSADSLAYIKLKSYQRKLGRINTRISKLNKYYNYPTELFARFIEMYYTNRNLAEKIAPIAVKALSDTINRGNIKELLFLEELKTS